MNPIILITSCNRDAERGCNDAIRNTWLSKWGDLIPHRFFMGQGCNNPKDDELVFYEDDGYESVVNKTQEAYRWAFQNGYDYVFQCDVDTYVFIPRLLSSGFEKYDYIGYLVGHGTYAGGGCGYWLSKKAIEYLVSDKPPFPNWSDLWVGNVLSKSNIVAVHDERYWCGGDYMDGGGHNAFPIYDENLRRTVITAHLGQGVNYGPERMIECHKG